MHVVEDQNMIGNMPMNDQEMKFLIKKIDDICTKVHKKIKSEIKDNFSEQWLTNHGPQILLATLTSLCSRVIHDFVSFVAEEHLQEAAYEDLSSKISDTMIKTYKQLKKQEMH